MSAEQNAVLIMNRQPQPILEKYSRDQVRQLYEFLHNDNPPYRYIFGFRRKVQPNRFTNTPTNGNGSRFQNQLTGQSAPWAESISSSGVIVTFRCLTIRAGTAGGADLILMPTTKASWRGRATWLSGRFCTWSMNRFSRYSKRAASDSNCG